MDIHKPKPARSIREFLIEIGTITVGILIATTLDAAVEAQHNHELVEHARVSLRAELMRNRDSLIDILDGQARSAAKLDALIAWGEARSKGGPASPATSSDLVASLGSFSTASWESTEATGALAHMSYAEANALSRAYAATKTLSTLEDQLSTRWFEISGLRSDLDKLSPAELDQSLVRLRTIRNYQHSMQVNRAPVIEVYDAALKAMG